MSGGQLGCQFCPDPLDKLTYEWKKIAENLPFKKIMAKKCLFSLKYHKRQFFEKNDNFWQLKKKGQFFGHFFTFKCQFSRGSGYVGAGWCFVRRLLR